MGCPNISHGLCNSYHEVSVLLKILQIKEDIESNSLEYAGTKIDELTLCEEYLNQVQGE